VKLLYSFAAVDQLAIGGALSHINCCIALQEKHCPFNLPVAAGAAVLNSRAPRQFKRANSIGVKKN